MRTLCWLVFLLGHVHHDACILEAFASYRNLLLKLNDDSNKSDVENSDDDRTDEYTGLCERRHNENAVDDDSFGEQGMSDDEWQHEDGDDTTDQQESTGHGDDGDDDDNDDNDSGSEYSDDDDVDYEDEDEESDDDDHHPLLAHAREVYASDSFRIFEHEYKKSLALSAELSVLADPEEFCDNYVSRWCGDSSKNYKVNVQWLPEIVVNCSCNYFSITGFLCSHSLQCLRCFRLEDEIPDLYLLKWQLKIFSNYQIPKGPSSLLLRSADDCTKVSRGTSSCNLYEMRDVCTDYDCIVAPLLRQAKDIYKPEIYSMFREEYKRLSMSFTEQKAMEASGCILNHQTVQLNALAVNSKLPVYFAVMLYLFFTLTMMS